MVHPALARAQFTDATTPTLADTNSTRGVSWSDFDLDGDPDLYIVNINAANRLLRNDGAGAFMDRTAGPLAGAAAGQAASWGDFDNDGDPDLYLTSWSENQLLRNDGAAGFADVTPPPLDNPDLSNVAAWLDIDRDGDLDLYVLNLGEANRMFRNDGRLDFVDIAEFPLDHDGLDRGLATADYDNDGDTDLYLVNHAANLLIMNRGDGEFTRIDSPLLEDAGPGRGAAWGDHDGDGDLDLYLVNDDAANYLFRNEGATGFVDATVGPLGDDGFGIDVAWIDVDLDAHLDLYWTNAPGANRLLRNDGSGNLIDVTSAPLDDPGESFCAGWADYDLDGDLDLYVGHLDGANRLLRNDQESGNHWLQIGLRGSDSGESAIGARVRLTAASGASQIRELSAGSGYQSQHDRLLAFGIGPSPDPVALELTWPGGRRQTFDAVAADQYLRLTEPSAWSPVPSAVLAGDGAGRAAAWVDFDEDGDCDLYLVRGDGPNQLLRNDGTASEPLFVDATATSGPLADAGPGRAAAWGDVDRDGDLDLFLANSGAASRLLRNDGLAGFVAIATDLLAPPDSTFAGAWTDFDQDGDLDLYLVNAGEPNRLLRNDGTAPAPVFRDATSAPPTALLADRGNGRAAAWADIDADGDPDLYLVNSGSANRLLRNDGAGFFTETTGMSLADPGPGRAAAWGDLDADADLDLILVNAGQPNRLYRNTRIGFIEIFESGLNDPGAGRDATWCDIDLDADLDLYLVNAEGKNLLYRNDSPGSFSILHNRAVENPGDSQSVAAHDIDADGDLDLYVINETESNVLLRNDIVAVGTGHWLRVELVGNDSNPSAIGARVRVVAGDRQQVREIGADSGSPSESPLRAHFGLGAATRIDTLEIQWPMRTLDRLSDITADRDVSIVESPGPWRDLAVLASPSSGAGRSVAWGDLDADGDLDLYLSRDGEANLLLRNDGAGRFSDATTAPLGHVGAGRGIAPGDFDNDGDLDLYLTSNGANALLRHDGAGFFTDVTDAALAGSASSSAAAWVDIDNDGDLDLHVCNLLTPNRVLRNDGGAGRGGARSGNARSGNARPGNAPLGGAPPAGARRRTSGFVDIVIPPLDETGSTVAAAWSDFDLDGDQDVYLCHDASPNRLLRNDAVAGVPAFVDVTSAPLGGDVQSSGAIWGDLDDDGDFDLYLTERGAANRLFRNDGFEEFADRTPPLLLDPRQSTAAALADFDLDGDLDLHLAGWSTGNRLLRNDGDGIFADATRGRLLVAGTTAGTAWGDFDLDGDPDLYQLQFRQPDRLLRNDLDATHGWLAVDLEGTWSTRSGDGARIRLVTRGLEQVREIGGGGGFLSRSSIAGLFGLRQTTLIDTLQVLWPSGVFQQRIMLPPDQRITLHEREGLSDIIPPVSAVVPLREPFELVVRAVTQGLQGVTLHARRGGSSQSFQPFPMSIDGSLLSVVLPFNLSSEMGIEYYFELRLRTATLRQPALAPDSLYFLPVSFTQMSQQPLPGAAEYSLIGLPFVPDDGTPSTVLEPFLGRPERTGWRLGRYDPTIDDYREYPSTEDFAPGRGYWLLQRRPAAIVGNGQSVNSVTGVEITLAPGWNLIAHPFVFPVAWEAVEVSAAPDLESRLIGYAQGGYEERGVLEAWTGYWLRNNGATAQVIRIPGDRLGGLSHPGWPVPPCCARAGSPSAMTSWQLDINAAHAATRAGPAVAGVAFSATDGFDRLDLHAVPPLPDHVAVWLELGDAGERRRLERDLRADPFATSPAGAVWQLVVQVPGVAAAATLPGITPTPATEAIVRFDGIDTVPAQHVVQLVEAAGFGVIDLRPESSRRLRVAPGETRRYWLVVGSSELLDEIIETARAPRPTARIDPNYPNPFNPSTTLRFALPAADHVSLVIYNPVGQLVMTLVDAPLPAGRHTVHWRGIDAAGREVPTGVYFYRFATGGRVMTRSMLLLR